MALSLRRSARPFVVAILTVAIAGWCASLAQAQAYRGSTALWARLDLTIANGQVTAFATQTGRLQTCDGAPASGSVADPVEVVLAAAPAEIVGGAFHFEGTTENDWGGPFTYAVDGKVSVDGRLVSGTITAGGDTPFARACTGTWEFEAIIPPRDIRIPIRRDFESATRGRVSFDYARGTITHLTADIGVTCPSGSSFGAKIDTAAYGLDPIRVRKDGTFRIEGAVLGGYDEIHRYVLSGRIRGTRATGTIRSYRLYELRGNVEKCAMGAAWRSAAPRVAPPTSTVYYDVTPYRYGRPSAWTYYLEVRASGCTNASHGSVGVQGGPRKRVGCRGRVRLGPLQPMRTYTVLMTAIRLRQGRVVARMPVPQAVVYLPGDDGDWVRIR